MTRASHHPTAWSAPTAGWRRTTLRNACIGLLFGLIAHTVLAAAPCNLFTLIRENDVQGLTDCLDSGGDTLANTAAEGGVTPLHLASALDRAEIINVLLTHGAWIDAPSAGGFTPLHWAAAEDATHALTQLLDAGADMAAATDNGITPLHWAASRNATNSVHLLLQAGLAVVARTKSGQTPLHWAVAKEAKDSALMIAFQTVTEGLDLAMSNDVPYRLQSQTINTNLPSTVAEPRPEPRPDIGIRNKPPIVLRATPTPRSGDTRMIALGSGEALSLVWVPDGNLWVGVTEISNGQFRRFRPSHDSGEREGLTLNEDDQPAVMVSWFDAQAFCEWLNTYFRHSMPAAMQCRLPTDAEWVRVARCGSQRRYPWGNDWPPVRGNHCDLSAKKVLSNWQGIEAYDDGYPVSCPVADAGVNEWGLYGLSGNVWEWCSDWYNLETRQLKVRKGGGWDFEDPVSLEIETRGFDAPSARYDTIGFRIVLAPSATSH